MVQMKKPENIMLLSLFLTVFGSSKWNAVCYILGIFTVTNSHLIIKPTKNKLWISAMTLIYLRYFKVEEKWNCKFSFFFICSQRRCLVEYTSFILCPSYVLRMHRMIWFYVSNLVIDWCEWQMKSRNTHFKSMILILPGEKHYFYTLCCLSFDLQSG